MRHQKDGRKLGRQSSHRKAMLRNLVVSLLVHERVTTTLTNAKEAKRLADRLITWGKANTIPARRRAFAVVADRTVVRRLFTEIAPRMNGHQGGYTRILRLRRRTGDNAELALLELTRLAPVAPKKQVGKPSVEATAPVKGEPSKAVTKRPSRSSKSTAGAEEEGPSERKKPRKSSADIPSAESSGEVTSAVPPRSAQEPEGGKGSESTTDPSSKKGFMDGLRKFFKK